MACIYESGTMLSSPDKHHIVSSIGSSDTAASSVTVTLHVYFFEPTLAVMVDLPFFRAVTVPLLTVATLSSEDFHSAMVLPLSVSPYDSPPLRLRVLFDIAFFLTVILHL